MMSQVHQFWGKDLILAVLANLYQVEHNFYRVFWIMILGQKIRLSRGSYGKPYFLSQYHNLENSVEVMFNLVQIGQTARIKSLPQNWRTWDLIISGLNRQKSTVIWLVGDH